MRRIDSLFAIAACVAMLYLPAVTCAEQASDGAPAYSNFGQGDAPLPNTLRVVVDGKVHTLSGYLMEGEYYFAEHDIVRALGESIGAATQSPISSMEIFQLRDVARILNVSYEHDTVLDAVYIWKDMMYTEPGDAEMGRAIDFEIITKEQLNELDQQIAFGEFAQMLSKAVRLIDSTKVAAWEESAALALASSKKMEFQDGLLALLYAAKAVDANAYNNFDYTVTYKGQRWDYPEFPDWQQPIEMRNALFESTITETNHMNGATELAQYCVSLYSKKLLFSATAQLDLPLSRRDGILAVVRLIDSYTKPMAWIPIEQVGSYDETIISDRLLKHADWLPKPTTQELPSYAEFLYYGTYREWSENEIRMISEWGFNAILLWQDYRYLADHDVTAFSSQYLDKLDRLIAWGLKYGVHIHYQFWDFPGWRYGAFDPHRVEETREEVELDFYVNQGSQEKMQRLMATLIGRYKGIPNNVLSFYVNYEPWNRDRATGLPAEAFGDKEIESATKGVIAAIRAKDPNRLLYYETSYYEGELPPRITPYMVDADVVHTFKYAVGPYAFWSFFGLDDIQNAGWVPQWPLYVASNQIHSEAPLLINGFLKKGTSFELSIASSEPSATLNITVDGKKQVTKKLMGDNESITFMLEEDTDKIVVDVSHWLQWAELNITFPQPYTFQRVWFDGQWGKGEVKNTSMIQIRPYWYEVHAPYSDIISIEEQGTFKTLHVMDKDMILSAIKDFDEQRQAFGVTAICSGSEPALSGVAYYDSWNAYYDDLLDAMKQYDISVPVDIWGLLRSGRWLYGMETVDYKGYQIGIEYLRTLQKHQ